MPLPTDQTLADQIHSYLLHDDAVSSQPISVQVTDGVVTLSGTVASYRRKIAAYEIAASVKYCKDVVDLIEVSPVLRDDETVAKYARAALDSHADIDETTITVSVVRGDLTLSGQVQTGWERTLAEDIALGVKGVRSVENHIVVDVEHQRMNATTSTRLEDALNSAAGLNGAQTRVTVNGPAIVLSGTVRDMSQKHLAGLIARRFRAWVVRNELRLD